MVGPEALGEKAEDVAHRDHADEVAALDDGQVAELARRHQLGRGEDAAVGDSKSAPVPASLSTSRSVKIPTGTVSSQTTTEPTFASSILRIAVAAVSSGRAVTSLTRITPPICILPPLARRPLVANGTIP